MLRLLRHSSTLRRVPNKYNAKHSASNVKPVYQPGLHHHPAPSTGHVETPDAFLPVDDPRKGLRVVKQTGPALSEPREQKLNLTPLEVEEIKNLRLNEPDKWTRKALATKFGVSPFTISLVSDANPERAEEMGQRLATIKDTWSQGRRQARLDREKRSVSWYRDE